MKNEKQQMKFREIQRLGYRWQVQFYQDHSKRLFCTSIACHHSLFTLYTLIVLCFIKHSGDLRYQSYQPSMCLRMYKYT